MAGFYTDIPGTRFALDQDGSTVKFRDYTAAGPWSDYTGSMSTTQNASTASYIQPGFVIDSATYTEMAVAFPEARSITGLFTLWGNSSGYANQNFNAQYSTDTTDGTDGTWTAFAAHGMRSATSGLAPYFRSTIASPGLVNIKGLRFRSTTNNANNASLRVYVLHIYGSRPSSGVDRLDFRDPVVDQSIAPAALDFGDNPQTTVVTRQFKIKNLSSSLTATNVSITVSDIATEFGGNVQLSTDNSTYLSTISIGNLAPGSISGTLYVRRTVPANETTTQRMARLIATAASWS